MHDGCAGNFANGLDVLNKVRSMGFSPQEMPVPVTLNCEQCQHAFEMKTFESHCPECGMVYAVTPCHAHDPAAIRAAGVNV
jgi:rubrerythrin